MPRGASITNTGTDRETTAYCTIHELKCALACYREPLFTTISLAISIFGIYLDEKKVLDSARTRTTTSPTSHFRPGFPLVMIVFTYR